MRYDFEKIATLDKLEDEIRDESLPLSYIESSSNTLSVIMTRELTLSEVETLGTVVTNHTADTIQQNTLVINSSPFVIPASTPDRVLLTSGAQVVRLPRPTRVVTNYILKVYNKSGTSVSITTNNGVTELVNLEPDFMVEIVNLVGGWSLIVNNNTAPPVIDGGGVETNFGGTPSVDGGSV